MASAVAGGDDRGIDHLLLGSVVPPTDATLTGPSLDLPTVVGSG